MNPVLQDKLNELESSADYECWYLVKQPAKFESICYLVSFLKEYQANSGGKNLSDFINSKIDELNLPDLSISKNYRALRVAAFYGLIEMKTSAYENSIITDAFEEINGRCSGKFGRIDLYADIMQRQIEKIIVATTTEFKNFWDTLTLIKLLRTEKFAENEFEKYKLKFDNRFIQALKQLPTLAVDKESISIKENFVDEVAAKVFLFERNPLKFYSDNYVDFLCSTKSLFEMEQFLSDTVERERISGGENTLLYGVPGSGKSWTIEHEYCNKNSKVTRVVFHPDYTYAEFVGQILPDVQNGEVTYKFSPGPFTSILRDAYQNPANEYILIIEEINRGNAPAIFGEVFQLLDRMLEPKTINGITYRAGTSEYDITNRYMGIEIYGDGSRKVRIPSNLSIIGTMNTSDQNVFTLDTAFQRRWNMRLIENSFQNVRPTLANAQILDTGVSWQHFCETINRLILDNKNKLASAEDKRLGVYFVHENDLRYDTSDNLKQNRKFAEKVIKYLWDDAFKFNAQDLFESSFDCLESVIRHFVFAHAQGRFDIFKQNVRDLLFNK